MRADERRRGWNSDPPLVDESTRSRVNPLTEISRRKRSSLSRNLLAGILTVPVALGIVGVCAIVFPAFDSKQTPSPAASHAPAPSPGSIPFPTVHDSVDTKCGWDRRCTPIELQSLVSSLRKQWEMTPEWLQVKCSAYSTYPSVEDCILHNTVAWLADHPKEAAPWVIPANFEPYDYDPPTNTGTISLGSSPSERKANITLFCMDHPNASFVSGEEKGSCVGEQADR